MAMLFRKHANRQPPFRTGDLVRVRSEQQVRATLDNRNTLGGLPFMHEMARFCGKEFRVFRRADRVFLDHRRYVARLKDTVLLEDLRCDGSAHGGCQMGCLLLWKEAWLEPPSREGIGGPAEPPTGPMALDELSILNNGRFRCQAVELVNATSYVPWWDAHQYWQELRSGNLTLTQFGRMLGLLGRNKLRRLRGVAPCGQLSGPRTKTASESLGLQPGESVEVKSLEEIEATVDHLGRNRGLGFVPAMAPFCGKRFRVARRVERTILEGTGELREVKDSVALEGVTCDGLAFRGCPRNCYHLWREIWLRRV
jgi:hypothetical protein